MAYVPGFEYDLFLSYDSRDDADGRVSRVSEELLDTLHNVLGVWPAVWLRDRMPAGTDWREHIAGALQRSATCVAFVSPAWLESSYAQFEFESFVRNNAGRGSDVHGVFRLQIGDVAGRPDWLPFGLTYDLVGLSVGSDPFRKVIHKAARDVAETLRHLRHRASPGSAAQRPSRGSVRFVLRPGEMKPRRFAAPTLSGAGRGESIAAWLRTATAAAELAQVVSLAARVEPSLLRLARLHLELGVEREAEVWFSPLVEIRNANGMAFHAEALDRLREALRIHPERLELAVRLTLDPARHASLPPATRLQEQITCEALQGELPEASPLREVLVAIVRENRTQLASWAASALARLPERVRQHPDASLLAQAVKASGVQAVPGFEGAPPPPSWMAATTPQRIPVAFALYRDRVDFRVDAGAESGTLSLPETFWVSWRAGHERRIREVRLTRARTVRVPIEGNEVRIEAADGTCYLLQARNSVTEKRTVFIGAQTEPSQPLAEFLHRELTARGYDAYRSTGSAPDDAEAAQRDFCLTLDGTGAASARARCRQVVGVDAPSSVQADDAVRFGHAHSWDDGLARLLHLLDSRNASVGALHGVPDLPRPFVVPPDFSRVRDMLLNPVGQKIVVIAGGPGSGKTILAAAVARDCEIRRRFSDGIHWHAEPEGPARATGASLVVVDEGTPEISLGGESRAIAIRVPSAAGDAVYVRWPEPALHQIFSAATGAEAPPGVVAQWSGRPDLTIESTRWWNALGDDAARQRFFSALERVTIPGLLQSLSTMQAALTIIRDPQRKDLVERILPAQFRRVAEVFRHLEPLFPKQPVSPWAARSAHRQLVEAWELECAGDWIRRPADPYYDHHLPEHLKGAEREDEAERLLRDVDWLERTDSQVKSPDWWARETYRRSGPWRWIAITGTGTHSLPDVQLWAAERLGREVARRNFGLVGGGWPGVDYVAAKAFVEELQRMRIEKYEPYLLHITDPGKRSDFPVGEVQSVRDSMSDIADKVAGLVVVGGLGGAYKTARAVLTRGKRVVALRGTGGDAEKLSDEPLAFSIDDPIDSPIAAGRIAAAAVRELDSGARANA